MFFQTLQQNRISSAYAEIDENENKEITDTATTLNTFLNICISPLFLFAQEDYTIFDCLIT